MTHVRNSSLCMATMLVTAEAYLGGALLQLLALTGIVMSTATRIKCPGS